MTASLIQVPVERVRSEGLGKAGSGSSSASEAMSAPVPISISIPVAEPEVDGACRLTHAILGRVRGKVQDLLVVMDNARHRVVLEGWCRTWHAKQLAQEVVIDQAPTWTLTNRIEVRD